MAKLYVNKPGGAIMHEMSGESVTYGYGQEVDLGKIRPEAHQYLPRVTSTERPPDAPEPVVDTNLEVAMEQAGQQHSSTSPIPGNYESLTEDQAVRLVQSIRNENDQAVIVAHEKQGENRLRVVDAATNSAQEQAKVLLAIESHKEAAPAKEEAPAEEPVEAVAEEVVEEKKATPKPKKSSKK